MIDSAPYDFNRNWGARCATDVKLGSRRAAVLENAALRVTVLLDHGADIVEFLHKPTDTDFLWRSPRAPGADGVGPTLHGGEFLDQYLGGWHEMLPALGPGRLHGAAIGLCGEVTLLPWQVAVERDEADGIRLRFAVHANRTPLHLIRTLELDDETPTLLIEETVTNLGGQRIDFSWGHHPTIGPAFLRPGCRIEAASGQLVGSGLGGPDAAISPGTEGTWPHLTGVDGKRLDLSLVRDFTPGWEEDVCLTNVGEAWVGVTDPEGELGFGLAWEPEVFPHLWIWQNFGGRRGYPWFGRTYCLGLEPISSFPFDIEDVLAAGTQLSLEPGAQLSTRLCATVYRPRTPLARIEPDGRVSFAPEA